jgi:hypothetical protein
MRWVLPGGAELTEINRKGSERQVVCRSLAAVLERTRPRSWNVPAQLESRPADTLPPQRPIAPGTAPLNGITSGAASGSTTAAVAAVTEPSPTSGGNVSEPAGVSSSTGAGVSVSDPVRLKPTERLATVKLLLEVLATLVGLIGGILALLGLSRK